MKTRLYFMCLYLFLIFTSGCTTVISKDLLLQAKKVQFDEVLKDPDRFKGEIIALSGLILESKNTKEGTLFEVLEVPSKTFERPREIDKSRGRFLALYKGYLDVAVYSKGRSITIAGEIIGKRENSLGEIQYTYPLVEIKDIHLWPFEEKSPICYYPPPYYWHPWWWHPLWW